MRRLKTLYASIRRKTKVYEFRHERKRLSLYVEPN
jgi:hypothetical protein